MYYALEFERELMERVLNETCCMVITDCQGRYRYANKAWCRIMGMDFENEHIVGKYVKEVIPDTRINQAIDENREISGFSTIKIGEISRRAFSVYRPIRNDSGLVEGGIIINIFTGDDVNEIKSKTDILMNELQFYKEELSKLKSLRYSIDNIIGRSIAVINLKEEIRKAAHSNSTVLITGETGSGKELVAQSLHGLSNRASNNFIKVNCAGIPKELLESEFFGYEKGAFTGANKEGKVGKFEQAHRGSLFLDEINQLSFDLQPKLLRVIQEREIERIGGSKSIAVDVRLIVATNKSLEKMVKDNTFREDLYYRLNVVNIEVPPLRERKEDIPLILDDMLDRLNQQMGMHVLEIPEDIKMRLMCLEYGWPGNIRELQNVLERGMNKAYGEKLQWKHFEEYFATKNTVLFSDNIGIGDINSQYQNAERDLVLNTLKKLKNKTMAAEALGISRTMLYKKIKKYNIEL